MRTVVIEFRGNLGDLSKRAGPTEVSFELPLGLRDLVQSQGVPHVEVATVRVDDREAPWTRRICGGEHIVVHPRYPAPLADPRFVLDGHLGTLARDLRLLGFDSWYRRQVDDVELVRVSVEAGRMLLTRDLGLLMRSALDAASYVRHTDSDEQIVEVLERFGLIGAVQPFNRCLACNGSVVTATATQVASDVAPGIVERFRSFRRCSGCGRVYWKGTHYERLQGRVDAIKIRVGESKQRKHVLGEAVHDLDLPGVGESGEV